jgi:hypothetical protein
VAAATEEEEEQQRVARFACSQPSMAAGIYGKQDS